MERYPHLIFWMPSCHSAVWCKSRSSRKKNLVHWQCRLPQDLRRKGAAIALLVAQCYSLLLWGDFSNSWMVREFFRIWAHYTWYYRKPSPTCFPAQSSSFLDYPSNQSFSKFHVMLTSCICHHSYLVKNKLCCCSSVKDRTSGSSSQANQTISTGCILHLHHHCSLFLLLLPKKHPCYVERVHQWFTKQE